MPDLGDGRGRRAVVWSAAAAVVFGLGVGAGTQLGGGGSRAAVPAGVATAKGQTAAPNSSQAAVEAAAGYATVMAQLFPLDADTARGVLAGDASDAYRTTLVQAADTDLIPLQQQMATLSGRPVFRQSVLASKVVSYTPTRAQVSDWVMLIAGQAGVADNAVSTFSTVTLDLVFERGAWKIDRSAEQPGPSPQMTGAPTAVDILVGRLAGFNDWRPR
jgi:hypothetical protein